jgi:hypothetical protein
MAPLGLSGGAFALRSRLEPLALHALVRVAEVTVGLIAELL